MTATGDAAASRVTSRDGTQIGYWTTGEGPPLVLVHGLLGDHTRWAALRPHLEPHFTVHAMDRRGRGASGDHPDYDGSLESEDAAAVIDAVAEASESSVDVLGSSGGACFALAAAGLTSNVRRLVLFEPPASEVAALVPDELLDRLDALLAADHRDGVLEAAYRTIVGLSDAEIAHLRAQPSWPNRVAAAHTVPRELRVPAETLFDPEQAARVTVPALVLVGGDSAEPYRIAGEAVAAALPNGRLTVLEGQGHGAELLAPEAVADAVLPFLRERA